MCYLYVERLAKGIWLFLPMAIALMINFGVFVTVLAAIWKKNRALRDMKQRKSRIQPKSKKDDGLFSQYVYKYLIHFLI